MDSSLKIFIIGFIVGLIIALAPVPGEVVGIDDTDKIVKQVLAGGITIWKVIYFSIVIVLLPFVAIEPLKKRMPRAPFPIAFLIGNSCAGGIVVLVLTVSTLFSL
jgi:hypothetical protein